MDKKDSNEKRKSEVALTEERILAGWKEKKIFEKTLEKTKNGKLFVFYDGPPFATGEPHYGHILAGTIKDAIPRYRTMTGRYVRRQWGWDCHGLPVENIIEQELKLSHKKDIEEYGIGNFNEAARSAVLRFDSFWKKAVPRLGRFVDMDLSYKTMDASYSESIWWAFKTLYDKGLIYEGHKVMYVCPRCETPVSNFEVAQGYKDTTDISVTVEFKLVDSPGTSFLAWTTTPWTLPGNVALAVGKDIDYVTIEKKDEGVGKKIRFILAKSRLETIFAGQEYVIVAEHKGMDLVGIKYVPPFDYYYKDELLNNRENGWKVYAADFVSADEGTGIAHEAPAFGEDDMNLGNEVKLPFVQHIEMDGRFKPEVKDFAGMYVKQKDDTQSADVEIIKNLAKRNLLFAKEKIIHPYPMCWRCDTPLLNYATPSWFVKVTKFRDKVVSENKKVCWVPEHVGEGRFGKWLEGARDWAISRSRYWGAPLPVWKCLECEKVEAIGSIEELKKKIPKSGNRYFVMRHGQAESNVSGTNDSNGNPDNHLTESGKESIKLVASKLSKEGITRIITSPFPRAKESADIIANELGLSEEKIVSDRRLIEFNHGSKGQGKTIMNNTLEPFNENDLYVRHGDGENHAEVRTRVVSAIFDADKTYKNETILIVTHGSPMWMLIAGALGMSDKETLEYQKKRAKNNGDYFISNGQVEEVDFTQFPHNKEYVIDLHRPYIDEVIYDCSCGGTMKRILDVFDCWFESGSMPYAQFHYPFENKEEFKKNFPADFIAEGLDQTRGWFYSLIILGVGLFGETPYRNVIVNGLVLGSDGQKMSKRLKNYPEVMDVVDKYGADSLRYYLLSSPIMRGEDLVFLEKGIDEIYKKNISRLNNVYSFYELYKGDEKGSDTSENILDKWIIARLNELKNVMTEGMEKYELDKVARPVADFIDDLSTWYIRRSRERFKSDNENDKKMALETTHFVLEEFSKLIAPLMPFIADDLYLKVTRGEKEESVHLESWPSNNGQRTTNNQQVIQEMQKVRQIVSLGLEARSKAGIKVRQPLQNLKLKTQNLEPEYIELIKDEVNVKGVTFDEEIENEVELDTNITPELKEEGDVRDLVRAIQDFRKKEGLTPSDKVALLVSCDEKTASLIKKNEDELKHSTLLSHISISNSDGETSFQVLNPGS